MSNFSKAVFYIVALIVIIIFALNADLHRYSTFFATILGVSTFLFGIFISFSISDRRMRIDKIRENDSEERSQLISIYSSAKAIDKDFSEKVTDSLDKYLMATLDYKIWDYYLTQKEYDDLFQTITKYEPESNQAKAMFGSMVTSLTKILSCRKSTIGLIDDRLSAFEWLVSAFLSLVIFVCLTAVNSGAAVSIGVILFLSIALFLVLTLLYSLDDLSWKEEERIFEPYSKTFESIGLMRYYPDALILQKRVKKHIGKEYRVGVLPKPYPDLSEKKIEVVKPGK
ncbi:MAG: hypothetical protein WCP91_02775 [Candidatus Berkelbacteria bacterium]